MGRGFGERSNTEARCSCCRIERVKQCCGFMRNSLQNVQSDLECVGGYQGEINSEERKKITKKDTF